MATNLKSADISFSARANPLRVSAVAIGVFILAYNVRLLLFQSEAFTAFSRAYPWQVGESVRKGLWVVMAVLGVMLAHRRGPVPALRELGLACPPGVPLGAAFVAVLPMLVIFSIAFPVNPSLSPLALWMTGLVSPVSEEVLFRGFLFRQLHDRARWPFVPAAAATAAPFAWGHLHQIDRVGVAIWGPVLLIAVFAVGATLFAWLLVRWSYNLWFVIGMHAFMNASWYIYAVDDTALGGWLANGARTLTVVAAIVITLYRNRHRPSHSISGADAAE